MTYRLSFVGGEQEVLCGIAQGSLNGSNSLDRWQTVKEGNGQTIALAGVMTIYQSNQNQILFCNGHTKDWGARGVELDFIKIDSVTEGTTG